MSKVLHGQCVTGHSALTGEWYQAIFHTLSKDIRLLIRPNFDQPNRARIILTAQVSEGITYNSGGGPQ